MPICRGGGAGQGAQGGDSPRGSHRPGVADSMLIHNSADASSAVATKTGKAVHTAAALLQPCGVQAA